MTSKRRRERMEQRKRDANNTQRTLMIVGGAVVVVVLAVIIISSIGKPAASGTQSAAKSDSAVCAGFPQYTGQETDKPALAIDKTKHYTATIATDKGEVNVNLFAADAPETVNNFMFLACNHFYDNLTFHRVLHGFVAQGGDPKGDGTGGPGGGPTGYTIPDEFSLSTRKFDKEGLLSMAHTGAPNSAGSQFFITYAPTPNLDGSFTIFGEVSSGMDVVNAFTERDPDGDTAGATPTRITTITVGEAQ